MNRTRSHRAGSVWFKILILFLAFHSVAHAHLTIEGVGQVGSGIMHPLMTPPHALILLTLALCLSQRQPFDIGKPMLVFSSVSAVALLLTIPGFFEEVSPVILIGIALGIAIIVAVGKPTPAWSGWVLCGVAAAGIGLDSKADSGSWAEILKTLLGTWLAMNGVVAYLAAVCAHSGEKLWSRTAVRIAAAWIIAICVMMLAFSFRKVS
ncbi:MAG: hypothetical protein QM680_08045 [Luteolibacter sp.]